MDQNQPPPYGQPPQGQPPYGQPYGQPQQPQQGQPYGQPQYGQMPPYGGDPYYYAGLVPRPGCIPLRPLSGGEIIGGVFNAIGRTWKLLLAFSSGVAVLSLISSLLINFASTGGRSRTVVDNSDPNHPVFHWGAISAQWGLFAAVVAVFVFLTSLVTAPLVLVFLEDVVGRRASAGFVWSRVRAQAGSILMSALVLGVACGVGVTLCLVPGALLWGIWTVAMPALMMERLGFQKALGRSKQLTSGLFWRVWGIRALGYLIAWGISAGVGVVVGLIGLAVSPDSVVHLSFGGTQTQHLPASVIIISSIGSAVATLITAPIRAGIDSLLYVDLRMRKEGLAGDLQRAASQPR